MQEMVLSDLYLKKLSLSSLMDHDFPRLKSECRLTEAARFFHRTANSLIAVENEQNELMGVVKAGDISKEVLAKYSENTLIGELVREPQLILTEEQAAQFTLGRMIEEGVSEVMIVDGQRKFAGAIVLNNTENTAWNKAAEISEISGCILESIYNGMLVINTQGKIIFCNTAVEQIFNRRSDEMLGKDICEVVPGSELVRVAETGHPQLACRIRVGSRLVLTNRTPVAFKGQLLGAVAVFQDITDFEVVSRELNDTKKLKASMEAIVENPYEGLVMIDSSYKVVMMNKFYLDLLGLTSNDVLGKHIFEITPHSQLPETVRTGKVQVGDHWEVNGQEFFVIRFPVKECGKIIGAIGKTIFKDMGLARVFAKKLTQLENDLEFYKEELLKVHSPEYCLENIVGDSEKTIANKLLAKRAAKTSSTVLITGESGTGKEVFAHAIHNASLRKRGPFIKVNCAAIPEHLLESELFGYADGAFTGARKGGKPGKFELANHGTIFLDEIGDMSLSMQAKLLRVLQEREIERVGSTQPIKVSVRIIAATNRDLRRMVEEKCFRSDLYYRLNVVPLQLSPLRERLKDLEPLTHYLIKRLNYSLGSLVEGISDDAMQLLKQYSWPGNVRELQNIIERAMNFADERLILPEHLPAHFRRIVGDQAKGQKYLVHALDEAEKEIIYNALRVTNGNKVQTAQILGIHRSVLYKKLAKYKISAKHLF